MKIVSIDVGISNLAICMLSLENKQSLKHAKIHCWQVLNLMDATDDPSCEPPTCSAIVKSTKKQCTKLAGFEFDKHFFCKTHEPHKGEQKPTKKPIAKKKKPKVKSLGKGDLCDRMIDKLDKLHKEYGLLNVDYVVIELQPGKNQKMKAFSEMIFTYFMMRRHDQDKSERQIKQVKYINAKNKLLLYDGPTIACKLKDKYARRKYFGVKHCEYLLNQQEQEQAAAPAPENPTGKFSDLLKNSTKRDDLADSYLQGLYFLKTKC